MGVLYGAYRQSLQVPFRNRSPLTRAATRAARRKTDFSIHRLSLERLLGLGYIRHTSLGRACSRLVAQPSTSKPDDLLETAGSGGPRRRVVAQGQSNRLRQATFNGMSMIGQRIACKETTRRRRGRGLVHNMSVLEPNRSQLLLASENETSTRRKPTAAAATECWRPMGRGPGRAHIG